LSWNDYPLLRAEGCVAAVIGGDAMSGEKRSQRAKPAQFLALSVLVGIILTSALVPLKPIMQQALIGITLVWIGVTAMVGSGF
jgi:hypothetical protein